MDGLSEVLRLARLTVGLTLDATARAPWCLSVTSGAALGRATAHLVLEGECRLKAGAGEVFELKSGELAMLAHGDAHLIGSALDAEPTALSTLVRAPVAGEELAVSFGGAGPATRWVALAIAIERHLAEPLLASLPAILRVDLRGAPSLDWLRDALGLTLSASDAPGVGLLATRARIAELLLIEALRRHVHSLAPGAKGWLAGLNDRYVGRALGLVHGRPSEPWTVERLGRQVGLSRSALAERFSDVMGEPIFAFLTRWRLQLAAEFLLATPRSIESIATEAGYRSASAFARAFKRVFGKPPSVWRKKSRRRPV